MPSPSPHLRPSRINPALPLGLLRSALFPVGCPDEHGTVLYVYKRPMPMASQRGETLAYRGPPLTQQHAMAWQAVLWAADGMGATEGATFEVSPDLLLRAMGGRGGDRSQRQRLARWLADLTRARIDYATRLHRYQGPLVKSVERTAKGKLALRLDEKLCDILGNEVLRNDLARKAQLGLNSLALWLHDYIATHLRPPSDSVDRLRWLCGSSLTLPQFRFRLRAALELLKAGPNPLVIEGDIDAFDRLVIAKKTKTRVFIHDPQDATGQRGKQGRVDPATRPAKKRAKGAAKAITAGPATAPGEVPNVLRL